MGRAVGVGEECGKPAFAWSCTSSEVGSTSVTSVPRPKITRFVSINVPSAFLSRWSWTLLAHEGFAAQRRKASDQERGREDPLQVDIDRIRERSRRRRYAQHQHLPSAHEHRRAEHALQVNPRCSFQHDELHVGVLLYSSNTVVPVIAAVTAAVVIFAPPASFGTRSNMAPPPRSILRVPSSKLKMVFAPRRASVWSANVSSVRDSTPVRTAVPSRILSFRLAGRGAPGQATASRLSPHA